jgi:hypothetical protein
MSVGPKLDKRVRKAIKYFWATREKQASKQGSSTGTKDAGARSAVMGGALESREGQD